MYPRSLKKSSSFCHKGLANVSSPPGRDHSSRVRGSYSVRSRQRGTAGSVVETPTCERSLESARSSSLDEMDEDSRVEDAKPMVVAAKIEIHNVVDDESLNAMLVADISGH